MEIGHFRLINGDELISIYSKSRTGYDLVEPLAIEELSLNGTTNIVLVQYNLSENEKLSIHKNHVVTFSTVSDLIKDYYLNSIEYNEKFIEKNKAMEIARVSNTMRDILDKNDTIVASTFPETKFVFMSPGSNTVN